MTAEAKQAKSFTTGHGGASKLGVWRSILRHHRRQTQLMARSHARYARQIQGWVGSEPDPYVLDLGCGGRAGVVLALGALGVRSTGIDYDLPEPRPSLSSWWRAARRNGPERAAKTAARQLLFDRYYYRQLATEVGAELDWSRLDVSAGDAHALDFDDDTFSFVFSVTVFEHIADVPAAASEIARVLRPGGEAYIITHLFPSPSGGHALDWAGEAPPINSPVPPWDHLRENRFPAHVYLNRHPASVYMDAFSANLEVLTEEYKTEGQALLTPALRDELSDWSVDDLTRRLLMVRLRKPG